MRRRLLLAGYILAFAATLGASWNAWALSMSVSGGWTRAINAFDLVGGAGSDLNATYASAADAVLLSIAQTGGGGWRVDIKKQDGTWDASLLLSARRTSSGTGGSVAGGDAYQQVTDTYATFFTGSEDVTDVNVQLRLSGVSVSIPRAAYTTTVYYTVTAQ